MSCCTRQDIGGFATMLGAIGQEHRLQIICILQKEGELCVCELIEILGLKQNLISHHLSLLKNIGLLTSRRDGKKIYYSLDKKIYQKLKSNFKYIFSL